MNKSTDQNAKEVGMMVDIGVSISLCLLAKLCNEEESNVILLASKDRLLDQNFEEKDIDILIERVYRAVNILRNAFITYENEKTILNK